MIESDILVILKCVFMALFFAIVVVVGTLPIRSASFKTNPTFRIFGTTFAGALFINIAIVHILPESADTIEQYLQDGDPEKQVFPLANLLVIVGFLITIFFTKVISTHSHAHDYQLSGQHHAHKHRKSHQNLAQSLLTAPSEDIESPPKKSNFNEAYFLTIAIYFHTLFEGIAIGVQNSLGGFLSTAVAIAFHKWADALSMGIHYRNRNIPKKTSYGLIIGQAILNVLAIAIGWKIDDLGDLTEAIFLSISAGTFLAISTMEMLGEQLHHKEYIVGKYILLLVCTAFVSSIWFIQNAIFSS